MLEKKLKKAIDEVNESVKAEQIPCSDQGKDALRKVIKGSSGFENTFDEIIRKGRKEIE